MKRLSAFFSCAKNIACAALLLLAMCANPRLSVAQVNVALSAVASQSSGGVTVYSPANYNDNIIVSWGGCSGYGTCPTPWGWVFDGGWIEYTWSSAVTFNKVVFYFADRPMTSCTVQYWNGSTFVNIMSYSTSICNADSITFPPVTTTILRFDVCTAPLINPNFREIQVWQSGLPSPTITGPTHYCTGDLVTLTASSTVSSPTYTWTGPSAFTASTATISFIASPATAGVYSCTVTSGAATSAPTLDTIVVSPLPTIVLTTTTVSACQGMATANLPYTGTTGGPSTYSIVYSGPALAAGFTNVTSAVLPASPIVLIIPVTAPAGSYTGTLKVSNGTCTSVGIPITIVVNPSPAAISGITNVCTGNPTPLTDATTGGIWSSSSTAIATVGSATGILTGVTPGTAVITYTLPTGCTATTTVNVAGISGPNHVCAGYTVTLAATSTGGAWSSGDSTVATVDPLTGVVTGVAMGVTPISYTLSSGCTAMYPFTVNPLAPILGLDSACKGNFRYLTNKVGGGVWSSSITTIATVLPDSGKVLGVASGITTISYLLPTGCLATTPFTVINYPGPISGATQVCKGATITLTNATPGGTWSTSNAAVATVNPSTGTVTGVFADTVDITYSIRPGCPVSTRVLVNPLPELIKGPATICPNKKDTMHDATVGGTWLSSSLSIATIVDTNGIVSGVSQGTATITYQLPTGCYQVQTLLVDDTPHVFVNYNWATNTFVATPGYYATYQWYDSTEGKIAGATTSTLAATETQYYWVEVTDSNGCKGVSSYYYYNSSSVGIRNYMNNTDIRIYPNPASSILYISSPVPVRAVISTIDGRKEIDVPNAHDIDISGLASGIYTITVYDNYGTRIAVQKLTKE